MAQGLVRGEGFAIDASTSRAVAEYVAALSKDNPDEISARKLSLTDPAARWSVAAGGPAFFVYSTNYLVDLHAGIIVDVEATPAFRPDEVNSIRLMIEREEQRFHIKPQRLVGVLPMVMPRC